MPLEKVRSRLRACGQEHLLTFWSSLSESQQRSLLSRIAALPLERLIEMRHQAEHRAPADVSSLAPVPVVRRDHPDAVRLHAAGEQLVRHGRVAAFTVAGGQGTRLGWRGPKGTFPATVITGKPLFRLFAEQLLARERRHGVSIPWYIMTSPLNDADTRAFFHDNNYFGRRPADHFFFPQGVVPTLDLEGRVLLSAPDEPATNPDGHGGSLRALRESGAIEDMGARGIEVVSYFQVDNPLVHVLDPLFIGAHVASTESSGEMSSKCVPKRDAAEKVGVLCHAPGPDGHAVTQVVEYSNLPREVAERRAPDGKLLLEAGSIAVHAIGLAFLDALTKDLDGSGLPWHRALKATPFVDLQSGRLVEPKEPNSIKFETFVFDALPLARQSAVLETSRVEEFAPIKNASGEDSPASSHALQSERAALWLEAHGVKVPRRPDGAVDARIEISPLTALEASDLAHASLPRQVERGQDLVL
ncbi:MAG: UTP--glucose-1-phosphate uridylyltransferase [Phycisphaeraceae bacterium]|nr:UTP--glucose-1-phosphate uridylyltransferase [Phycisphaeraceae bacterium]